MPACQNCGKKYRNIYYNWCKPCQTDNLKENFTNWTSGNEKIDGFIQEMQLKINKYNDIIFEWIPYNQFSDIKEISRGDFSTVYSAIWKDGPLGYNKKKEKYVKSPNYKVDKNGKKIWEKKPNKEVILKCLHNSQNITSEFLNEV